MIYYSLNMKKLCLITMFIASVFAFSGCGNAKSKPLATVNGKVITVGDFEKRVSKMPAYYKTLAGERKKDFLDDMINEQLIYKEALRRGINREPEVKELLDEAKRKILIARLMETEVKKSAVNEDKIKEFYAIHKDDFVTPLKLRASHIMVDTEAEANEVLQKLKDGGDFAQLAKQYSKDPSKARGGDLGYFIKGQLMPEIEEVCFKLQVGQMSDIIKTKFGYHIIKLTDRIEPRTVELSEVRDAIEKELKDKAQQKTLDDLVKNLRSKAHIKINEKLLEAGPGK